MPAAMTLSFAERAVDYASRNNLIAPESRVLVALSGGADSSALLVALCEAAAIGLIPLPIAAAHFHHGLRGADADDEAAQCVALCTRLNLPCYVELGALAIAAQPGKSPQAEARRHRYAYLVRLARTLNADRIAVAHHANDQAETVLLRILRGTGVDGLAGMPARRPIAHGIELIRPLLWATRSEIETYCADRTLHPASDPSNINPKYVRSRLRVALPEIAAQFNPRLTEALLRLADNAREDSALLTTLADTEYARCVTPDKEGASVILSLSLSTVPPALARRVLLRALRQMARFVAIDPAEIESATHVATLMALLRGEIEHGTLAGQIQATRLPDTVVLAVSRHPGHMGAPETHPMLLQTPGITDAFGLRIVSSWQVPMLPEERRAGSLRVDFGGTIASKIREGRCHLALRRARLGERFTPLGMPGQTKLVRDAMADAHWPVSRRDEALVLADSHTEEVLWIVGLAQSESTRVAEGESTVLHVHVAPRAGMPSEITDITG